jgi:eukaryotic-like serine/threonine-protein kinase
MADRTGQHLGNYRLVQLLGQGGFAEVYLGEHIHLGTQAAIKLLHTQLAGEDTDAFRTEARTIARLVHPHIVRVFDFGIEGETPFLVMDYAPGGTVRKRHPRGVALPLPTILDYVKQVAEALQYAHDGHFIHRDIKPENLLVGRRQEILLSDFGIALLAQTSRSQSMQDVTGTASYMAPEQFQGKPRQASDQYALAVMVYEWLAGACPFRGSFTEIASQHLFVPPPPLREQVPGLSPAVEQVVLTALAKDPHQRFASVRAFATAFEQASQVEAANETIPASQSVHPTNERALLSQSQQPTQLATALSQSSIPTELVAPSSQVPLSRDVISETASTEAATRSTPSPQPAQATRSIDPSGPTEAAVSDLSSPQPVQPVPSKQPAVVVLPLPPQQVARVSPPPGTTLYTYRGHSHPVNAVAWSPDGSRIASGSGNFETGRRDETLQVWDAATGTRLLAYQGAGQIRAVAWSPDGKHFAAGSGDPSKIQDDHTVRVWDASTGSNLCTYNGHAACVISLSWSPDGTRIASGSVDTTVQVWDVATGQILLTYRVKHLLASVAWSPDGTRVASGGKTVQVWDAATGNTLYTYQGHKGFLGIYDIHVAWSPDGTRIASGGADQSVQVWDAATGNTLYVYQSQKGGGIVSARDNAKAVAWSPDGRRIAKASGGKKTVQVWDAADGQHVFTYHGHRDDVHAVAWSPDGTRIASGSNDKTVQVWQAV